MTKREVSVAFQTNKSVTAYGELGSQVEAFGFDVISVYNDLYYQPAWLPLSQIAQNTSRIQLGPAAVNPFLSHPITIAGQIALLDELSQGRAYLGLARGAWLESLDIRPQQPIAAVQEAFEMIRHLLSQTAAPFAGNIFSMTGEEKLRWHILRPDIPFLLGSWGERTIAACAPHVQEVKLGGTANPALAAHKRRLFDRPTNDNRSLSWVVGAVTVVDDDREAARELARREVALYLPIVAKLDATLAIEPEWLTQFESSSLSHKVGLISDEALDTFAFAGNPDDIIAQCYRLFEAGTDRIEFGVPHGLTTKSGLQLLGTKILPALRQP